MNESEKYIKNSVAISPFYPARASNTPEQYGSRQKQYMKEQSRSFAEERAYLASDYVSARVQGITEDFYSYVGMNIRLADIVSPSATTSKRTDDFKEILIPDASVAYIPIGAKIITMGSTWLVINPSNLSTAVTKAVVGRCNASYNSYDAYGNVVTEPLLVEKVSMLGNDGEKKENIVLMDGYFNITCQKNENTERLSENSRIIMGKKAYYITGFADFIQEFTGDRESNKLITFTARVTEPTESDDVTVNYIANAKNTVYSASMNGQDSMRTGTTARFIPQFVLNGAVIPATVEYPQTWEFASTNTEVATVDENGIVTAIGAGNALISATLAQNPSITATSELEVTEGASEPYVEFLGFVDKYIRQYDSATYDAAYFDGGTETDEPLQFSYSGATENDYIATVSSDRKSVTIECVSASETPLQITASCSGKSATISVELSGY